MLSPNYSQRQADKLNTMRHTMQKEKCRINKDDDFGTAKRSKMVDSNETWIDLGVCNWIGKYLYKIEKFVEIS